MDKPSSEPIRIKINGKEREITESKKNSLELKEEIPFSSWQEKIKAELEVASAKKEEEFPWLLPDEDEVFKEDPKVVTPFKKKKQPSNQTVTPYHYSSKKKNPTFPLKQLIVIIMTAIVLGVGFGFVALNFLSNEEMPVTASVDEPMTDGTETGAETSSVPEENKPGAPTALQLYAVQAGKFSSKAGADTVVAALKSQGFAGSVIEEEGAFFVFAGVGNEKAQTEAMNTLLMGKLEIEPWGGKTFSVELPEQITAQVGSLSSIAAKVTSGQTTDTAQIVDLETKIKAIETKDEALIFLKEQLLAATTLLKEPNTANGWKAQQALLDAVSSAKNK